MGIKEKVDKMEVKSLASFRKRLTGIEGKCSGHYFKYIFRLFDKRLRPEQRYAFHAYDGMNNLLNLVYELLFWKCYRALTKAHLETHLGFLLARPNVGKDSQDVSWNCSGFGLGIY